MNRTPGRARDQRGAIAVMVAVSLTMLIVAGALVLDFGLVRFDRQINRSAADSSALAGAQASDLDGTDAVHPFRAACGSLDFLRRNDPRFSALTGTWSRGDGTAAGGNPCDPASTDYALACVPDTPSSWAWFRGSAGGVEVVIKSGYLTTDGGFPDESLLAGDTSPHGGCDRVGVIITQTRAPGLGSLATGEDLVSRIRSVAQINPPLPPEETVALLLLERNNCVVLDVDGGRASIRVRARGSSPGRIHSDSLGDRTNCGTGSQVMNGNITDGIVAEQNTSTSPSEPGAITLYALSGVPGARADKAYDEPPMVVSQGQPGNKPIPGKLVTRSVVDKQYRKGVQDEIAHARAAWSSTPLPGDKVITNCRNEAHPSVVDALGHTGTVYFDCPRTGPGSGPVNYGANLVFSASRVIVNTAISTSNDLSFPEVRAVYIHGIATPGTATGLDIGGNKFRMNHGRAGGDTCTERDPTRSATLVTGLGGVKATNNSLLQLCNTAVILMGDGPIGTGCLPTTDGTPPRDTTACDTAELNAQGGTLEWTAPNRRGSEASQTDWDLLEDLALWTESAGNSHGVGGGAAMHLAGVFMLPNADYFNITGSADQNVENSQYVARRLRVAGNGTLTMAPNPEDTVKFPVSGGYSLIR